MKKIFEFFKKHLIFAASVAFFLFYLFLSLIILIFGDCFLKYTDVFEFSQIINFLFFPIVFVAFVFWATVNFEKDKLFSIIAILIILISSLTFVTITGAKYDYDSTTGRLIHERWRE